MKRVARCKETQGTTQAKIRTAETQRKQSAAAANLPLFAYFVSILLIIALFLDMLTYYLISAYYAHIRVYKEKHTLQIEDTYINRKEIPNI